MALGKGASVFVRTNTAAAHPTMGPMTSSKHARWQARWQLDAAAGLATHDNGLRVRLLDGRAAPENAEEVAQALASAHGPHNASAMVQRLVREGGQLLVDPFSRGWRGESS